MERAAALFQYPQRMPFCPARQIYHARDRRSCGPAWDSGSAHDMLLWSRGGGFGHVAPTSVEACAGAETCAPLSLRTLIIRGRLSSG